MPKQVNVANGLFVSFQVIRCAKPNGTKLKLDNLKMLRALS